MHARIDLRSDRLHFFPFSFSIYIYNAIVRCIKKKLRKTNNERNIKINFLIENSSCSSIKIEFITKQSNEKKKKNLILNVKPDLTLSSTTGRFYYL